MDAKAIPAGPLFEVQEQDKDHPEVSVIRCYRNVQRITDDRRYRLFDFRLQRFSSQDIRESSDYQNGIYKVQDDFKRPLDPLIRLLPKQRKAIEEGKYFLYYGYDSQIYLVEDAPEIFQEPAKGEHFSAVSTFPRDNRIVYVSWGLAEGVCVTCVDISSKAKAWRLDDHKTMFQDKDPFWFDQIYWLDARHLVTIEQGRKASLISIFDAEAKRFVKGEDGGTWFRIVGNRVLRIDAIDREPEQEPKRKVSTYFSVQPQKGGK